MTENKLTLTKPLTEADLDPAYLHYYDLRVYTRVLATIDFFITDKDDEVKVEKEDGTIETIFFKPGDEVPVMGFIEVLDVPATYTKISEAKGRSERRRAAKGRPHVCTDECKHPPYKPAAGLNRAERRRLLKKYPAGLRDDVKKHQKAFSDLMAQYASGTLPVASAPEQSEEPPTDFEFQEYEVGTTADEAAA